MGKTASKTATSSKRPARKTVKKPVLREYVLRLHFSPDAKWGQPLRMAEVGRIMRASPLNDESWRGIVALSKAEWARAKSGATLDTVRSERVKLVQQLIAHSRAVYGDDGMADRWFKRPNPYLRGKAPQEVLDSLSGIAEAMAELDRIEAGVFA
jgi:putative toxin-antitoxin system antitoxin component (TIGR02293 family)